MKKYRYFMGGMFTAENGDMYDIYCPSPFVWETEEAALADQELCYRFGPQAITGLPVIYVFEGEGCRLQTPEEMEADGAKTPALLTWVAGDAVSVITWRRFRQYGGEIRKLKEEALDQGCIDDDDFLPTNETFEDLFPNIRKQNKLVYIDDESYVIVEEVEDDE